MADSLTRFWQWVTVLIFAGSALVYVLLSLHWRIMVDSAVMHYVVFLMRHGRAPYTQISDNNMPGGYFVEALGMSVFGGGDLGWRLYEFAVLSLLTVALVDIARRWHWCAGIFASGLFLVLHSAEGPQYAAERELSITTLLAAGLALLFRAVDDHRPMLMGLFGVCAGVAVSIKPTFLPLAFIAVLIAAWRLHTQRRPLFLSLAWATMGLALVLALDLAFLLHFQAVGAFDFILQHVIPAYVGMGSTLSFGSLLVLSLPRLVLPLLALALVLLAVNIGQGERWSWQRWTLLVATVFGFLSFLVQRKGFLHHRYTFEIFLFLLVGIEVFRALPQRGWPRWIASTALAFTFLVVAPKSLLAAHHTVDQTDLERALQADLEHLGGSSALNNNVVCFDLVYGCLDALYHLRIVEDGSFTGDLLFFARQPNAATDYYRARFWGVVRSHPPDLIVLTNQNLESLNDFDKVRRWPAFQQWLNAGYVLVGERHFAYEHFGGRFLHPVSPPEQDAYRLYVRRGSPLQSRAAAISLGSAKQYPDHFACLH